jgi:23S rRNA pseudouridine2605 synthase
MMHPSYEVEREYVVPRARAGRRGNVPDKMVDRLRRGVALEDGPAKFDEIERIGGTDSHDWFRVVVKEGRNREVRRLWESQGCQVSRLKRTRYGKVTLPQPLLRGQSQELPERRSKRCARNSSLEDGAPAALTLQPVIGQRKAAKATVHVSRDRAAARPTSTATTSPTKGANCAASIMCAKTVAVAAAARSRMAA